uniref:Uncharacterized protein n=1 Tax=Arundo donax TaxID=35708 RepID=A0A0A9EIP4_ARUDO
MDPSHRDFMNLLNQVSPNQNSDSSSQSSPHTQFPTSFPNLSFPNTLHLIFRTSTFLVLQTTFSHMATLLQAFMVLNSKGIGYNLLQSDFKVLGLNKVWCTDQIKCLELQPTLLPME